MYYPLSFSSLPRSSTDPSIQTCTDLTMYRELCSTPPFFLKRSQSRRYQARKTAVSTGAKGKLCVLL